MRISARLRSIFQRPPSLSDLTTTIRPMPLTAILECLEEKRFFRFPRLLHGFWDRVTRLTAANDLDSLTARLAELRDAGHPLAHYYDLIGLMRNPPESVKWGVYPAGHPFGNLSPESIRSMNVILGKAHVVYNGCVWKELIVNGGIDRFIEAIGRYKVVVVGLPHLISLKDRLNVARCDFIEAGRMTGDPVTTTKEEFQKIWLDYHSRQTEPIVYLTQLASAGSWIIAETPLREAFVFDMGLALEYWLPPRLQTEMPWMKFIKRPPLIHE